MIQHRFLHLYLVATSSVRNTYDSSCVSSGSACSCSSTPAAVGRHTLCTHALFVARGTTSYCTHVEVCLWGSVAERQQFVAARWRIMACCCHVSCTRVLLPALNAAASRQHGTWEAECLCFTLLGVVAWFPRLQLLGRSCWVAALLRGIIPTVFQQYC